MTFRCLALLAGLLVPLPALADGRVALVVGVSQIASVDLLPLPNALADARAIGAKLRTLGFDTDIVLEPTRDELRQSLSSLFLRRQRANADTALIYFAGHGLQAENKGYLLAHDSEVAPRSVLDQRQEVSLTDLLGRVSEAKLAILMLDACRNTPSVARALVSRTRDTLSAGLPSIALRTGIQAIVSYSTLPNARALDAFGDHPNSPYAEAMLDFMNRPNIEIAEMLRGVDDYVSALTHGAQQPTFEDRRGLGVKFYFRPTSLAQSAGPSTTMPGLAIQATAAQVSPREALARLTGITGGARASALSRMLAPPGLIGPVSAEVALELLGDIPDDAGRRRRALSAMLPQMDLPIDPLAAGRLLVGLSEISRLAALSDMLGCLARPLPDDLAQALIEGIPRADIPRLFRQLTVPAATAARCGS